MKNTSLLLTIALLGNTACLSEGGGANPTARLAPISDEVPVDDGDNGGGSSPSTSLTLASLSGKILTSSVGSLQFNGSAVTEGECHYDYTVESNVQVNDSKIEVTASLNMSTVDAKNASLDGYTYGCYVPTSLTFAYLNLCTTAVNVTGLNSVPHVIKYTIEKLPSGVYEIEKELHSWQWRLMPCNMNQEYHVDTRVLSSRNYSE